MCHDARRKTRAQQRKDGACGGGSIAKWPAGLSKVISEMTLYESGEDYLETILVLKMRNGKVRSVDVAAELDFSKPSVSRAIGILKKEGLVEVGEGGWISLTDAGERRAAAVFDRHNVIAGYLNRVLGVDKETAEEDACRIEHIISENTFKKMKERLGEVG